MDPIVSSEAEAHYKPVSPILYRMIAGLIDCVVIAAIDCALMYAFWIVGMAAGILDARPEHWMHIICTIPLFLLDGLTGIAVPVAMIYMNYANAFPATTVSYANAFFVCLMLANWLYHAEFESSSTRGTPGKLAMELAVVSARNGGDIDFGAATLRHFAKVISSTILFIGYLPIFGKRKLSLHDQIANCAVSSDT